MQPLTLYADMANWIDLAEGRVDSRPLATAIAGARVVPVLSLPHLLELASNPTKDGRVRVANCMDSIEEIGSVKWLPHYRDVIRNEAASCFNEILHGKWECPAVFFDTFHDTVRNSDREPIMAVGERMPPLRISEIVDVLAGVEEFQEYRADCFGYPDLRQNIVRERHARRAKKRFTEVELRTWLAKMLPEQVDVAQRQKFAEEVDLTKCPAFRAIWAFHEASNLDPKGARASDIADLWHLSGAVYCDVAFADRRTVEVLRQGNYEELPKRNSEFPGWIRSLA